MTSLHTLVFNSSSEQVTNGSITPHDPDLINIPLREDQKKIIINDANTRVVAPDSGHDSSDQSHSRFTVFQNVQ